MRGRCRGLLEAQLTARRIRRLALAVALCAAVLPVSASGAAATSPNGSYIVLYKQSVDSVNRSTDAREQRDGFHTRFRYGHAIKGFAATLTPGQVNRLESDPSVASVVPDLPVHATASVPLFGAEPVPPTGLRRIEASSATT
ncbi:MAG: hypothetical protein QOF37_2830, partial [Thermoleophilaceae bacterium]|nr:hypothetical protein [Thermoleophilaceae bacterium]